MDFTGHDTNPRKLLEEKMCSGCDEKLVSVVKTSEDAEFEPHFFGSDGR